MEARIKYIGKCLLITEGKSRVLVIGDLHLGFEESLNKSGVFVSRQMFDEMISDLNAVFGEIKREVNDNDMMRGAAGLQKGRNKRKIVNKVVLLGDIKHDFGGILRQEWQDVVKILDYFESVADEVIVIRGNHDTILEPILKKRKMKMHDYYVWKEFCFIHGHEDFSRIWKDKKIKTLIVGHGHPAIKLRDEKGVKVEKYKCFLIGKFKGKEMIVVPSFIDYYVGSDPREGEVILAWDVNFSNFDVKIVGENLEVLDFGRLKRLK